ncbi:MAG: prenyltransferase [Oligoflexia bacterium]|nr:prenyltransferase [Oligoflexia bacterium]
MNHTELLPSNHERVQKFLLDFRLKEKGSDVRVRLSSEGKMKTLAFSDFEQEASNVLLEYLPSEALQLPSIFIRWLFAIRAHYLMFSILPILLVFSFAFFSNIPIWVPQSFSLVSTILLLQISCHLWSEYEDHMRGLDSERYSLGSGVIQKLWIPALHLKQAAAALFCLSIISAIHLFSQVPKEIWWPHLTILGIIGAIGAASYSGWPFHYKYFGLGEPIVFFLTGPIMTYGTAILITQNATTAALLAMHSIPLALAAVLLLHIGNMVKIPADTFANTFTIARFAGFRTSQYLCVFLVFLLFISSSICYWYISAIENELIPLLSLPIAYFVIHNVLSSKGPFDPYLKKARIYASVFYFLFGILYSLGIKFHF